MKPRFHVRAFVWRLLGAFALVDLVALVAYAVLVPLVLGEDTSSRFAAVIYGLVAATFSSLALALLAASWLPALRRTIEAFAQGQLAQPRDRHVLYAAPRRAAAITAIAGTLVLAAGYVPGDVSASSWRTSAAHLGAVCAMMASLVVYAATRIALRPIVETLRPDRESDEDLLAAVRPPIDRVGLRVAFAIAVPAAAAALIGSLIVLAQTDTVDVEQQSAAREVWNLALSVERRPGERESGVDGAAEALRQAGVSVSRGIRDWVVTQSETPTPRPAPLGIPIALAVALVALFVGRRIGDDASRDLDEAARRMTVVGTSEIRSVTQRIARPRSIPEVREMAFALDALASTLIRMAEDQKRAVDVRAETARLRSFVLASVSHDLRGPLNSVLGFADLLLSGVEGELTSGQHESLEALARGGRDLLRLVDDLLDHARSDAGRLQVERGIVEVDKILERGRHDALERTRNSPLGARAEVAIEGESGLVAYADEERIGSALGALVAFAMIRPGSDGRASVHVHRMTSAVEFMIRGGGTTPSRDALDKLFDPFDFAPTGARAPAGLNLAVAVARKLISMHGGSVDATPHDAGGIELRVVIPAPDRPRTLPPGFVRAKVDSANR